MQLAIPTKQHDVDATPVLEAYRWVSGFLDMPRVVDVHNQYLITIEARQADWQAMYFPDDFYEGAPGTFPKRVALPDSMQADNPFEALSATDVRYILDAFGVAYLDVEVKNPAVISVW